jgi:hypothetical protein
MHLVPVILLMSMSIPFVVAGREIFSTTFPEGAHYACYGNFQMIVNAYVVHVTHFL